MADDHTSDESTNVHALAGHGQLARSFAAADPERRRALHRAGYAIVAPIVFLCVTRPHEIGRGHFGCAAGVHRLEPDCLDRFQDDVEAVLSDLFRNARKPIHNVEGWVRKRLTASTVDGHRRRRGLRGALQRPRLTKWLIDGLPDDVWFRRLAIEILEWVGVPHTAGTGTWPLTAWTRLRARVTGEPDCSERVLAAEIETVLAAMRTRPAWYEAYVATPMGKKEAPVLPATRAGYDTVSEPSHLSLTEDHELEDARLLDLASLAIAHIAARIAAGEPPRTVVEDVLRSVFNSGTCAEELGRSPDSGPAADERTESLLADPAVFDRIVKVVLDIVEDDRPS